MQQLTPKLTATSNSCPYINDKIFTQEYFFAFDVSQEELNYLLEKGWRKFGQFFFRPACLGCKSCIPIRIRVNEFKPTKSQKRIIKKNQNILMKISPLTYKKEYFELYKKHSLNRFNNKHDTSENDFIDSFFSESTDSFITEYLLDNKLIGCGFLDRSTEALNSIYFCYDTDFSELSLGTFSALTEIQLTVSMGLKYYYLGYYIKENNHMSYKNNFKPYDLYDWSKKEWISY